MYMEAQTRVSMVPENNTFRLYFRCRLPPFAAITPLPAARNHISLLAYTCCLCRSVPTFIWDVAIRAIECVCLAVREGVAGLSGLLSLCLTLYVRACDNHVPCVLVTCWETLAAMVACVEEVCKIHIWLFRNVRGEGFEGSSVVRMARGKICFRFPRQKAVTANLNSRDLTHRLGPVPNSGTWPI